MSSRSSRAGTARRNWRRWTTRASTWRCCSPAGGLFTLGDSDLDPALATAISRAYNDWLADFCGGGPSTSSGGRLFGAAMIPPQDIEGAVAEARRAVKELGFRTVFVRPNPVAGRNWHDPHYDPLWAEIQNGWGCRSVSMRAGG